MSKKCPPGEELVLPGRRRLCHGPSGPGQEGSEGLLQQWREEGSSQVLSTVSDGPLVDKGLAESSLALLMDNLENRMLFLRTSDPSKAAG